jgi:hypothetical protein
LLEAVETPVERRQPTVGPLGSSRYFLAENAVAVSYWYFVAPFKVIMIALYLQTQTTRMFAVNVLLCVGIVLSLCSLPSSAQSQGSVTDFVLGNVEFVLLHELAHALINDLDIPVIGSEETAADYIAATVLLRADQFDPTRAERAREFLLSTANGLATSWEVDLATGREIQYWGVHALTIQRYYNIVCLLHGSNPELFASLPARMGMPEFRAVRCAAEYARADRSLQWLIDTYGRKADDGPGAPVDVSIAEPPSRASQAVVGKMQAEGLLENVVARLQATFTLTKPIRISVRRCRQRQAEWLPELRELVICYELIDNYYLLGTQYRAGLKRQGASGRVPKP